MSDQSDLTPMGGEIAAQMLAPAEEYGNREEFELAWAIKAHEHAQVHMNLLMAIDPSKLRLCKRDDDIYKGFRESFPDLPLQNIPEPDLKSETAKDKWRSFIDQFKDVEDYNFGTLLRINSDGIYESDNTILVSRIQFLAIEIARNREGINSAARDAYTAKHKADAKNS